MKYHSLEFSPARHMRGHVHTSARARAHTHTHTHTSAEDKTYSKFPSGIRAIQLGLFSHFKAIPLPGSTSAWLAARAQVAHGSRNEVGETAGTMEALS